MPPRRRATSRLGRARGHGREEPVAAGGGGEGVASPDYLWWPPHKVSGRYLAPWLAVGVVLLLGTVVLSYRQVVHAYPSGGGDYEVAMKNHGRFAGLVVASALLVDYVLTVAVSISAGTDNIISAFPSLDEHRVLIAVGLVAVRGLVSRARRRLARGGTQ